MTMNKEMSEIYKFSHYLHDNDDGDVDVRGTWIRSVKSANPLRILLLSEIEFLQSCQIFLCTSVTEFDSTDIFFTTKPLKKNVAWFHLVYLVKMKKIWISYHPFILRLQGFPISRENVHEDTNISGEGIFWHCRSCQNFLSPKMHP